MRQRKNEAVDGFLPHLRTRTSFGANLDDFLSPSPWFRRVSARSFSPRVLSEVVSGPVCQDCGDAFGAFLFVGWCRLVSAGKGCRNFLGAWHLAGVITFVRQPVTTARRNGSIAFHRHDRKRNAECSVR